MCRLYTTLTFCTECVWIFLSCRPVAIALYECDTLGDDKSLAIDEGEIIEVNYLRMTLLIILLVVLALLYDYAIKSDRKRGQQRSEWLILSLREGWRYGYC